MRSERGYSLIEVLITLGLIGIVSAIAIPVFIESNARNNLWTGSEQMGAMIRQARLRAISQNTGYRVDFNCPGAGEMRMLILTGDGAVDNAVGRCNANVEGDSGTLGLPSGVEFDPGDASSLEVSGRGIFTAIDGAIPLVITVSHGGNIRTLTVSATGQISFEDVQ